MRSQLDVDLLEGVAFNIKYPIKHAVVPVAFGALRNPSKQAAECKEAHAFAGLNLNQLLENGDLVSLYDWTSLRRVAQKEARAKTEKAIKRLRRVKVDWGDYPLPNLHGT